MKTNIAPLVLFAAASLAVAQTTQPTVAPASAPSPAFATIANLEGAWTIEGKWANGEPFKGRQQVERVLNGKFVQVKGWSSSRGEAESPRDVVMYGTQNGTLVQWTFTPDGNVRQTPQTPTSDGSIQFDWKKVDGKGKELELRMIINPIDDTKYRWRNQMFKGGEWHTLIDGEWKKS